MGRRSLTIPITDYWTIQRRYLDFQGRVGAGSVWYTTGATFVTHSGWKRYRYPSLSMALKGYRFCRDAFARQNDVLQWRLVHHPSKDTIPGEILCD